MDVNPSPSPHVEGSVNPVTENSFQGSGDPNVEAGHWTPGEVSGGKNILPSGGGYGGFALGNVPD